MSRSFRLGATVALLVGTVASSINQSLPHVLFSLVCLALFLSVIWLTRTRRQIWLGFGVLFIAGVSVQHLLGLEVRVPMEIRLLGIPLLAYFFWMGMSGVQHDEYVIKLQDQGHLWGLIVGLLVAMFGLNLSQTGSPLYWMSLGAMVCGLVAIMAGYLWTWWNLR